ncbi:MAG: YigZ family protein [Haloarculaceae archaeon]
MSEDGGEAGGAGGPDPFRTVAGRGEATFERRGSTFIGRVAPVPDEAAAEAFVEEVRSAHPDATHNAVAYRVRADPLLERADDDGEPTGSAGDPALNVLVQRDLQNVVAVVTRYYGGTNLGVGGLARAYGRGVKAAVADAGVTERRPHVTLALDADYDDAGSIRAVLESAGVDFEAEYGERVDFAVRVPRPEADALADRLRSATGGRVSVERDGEP